MQTGTSVYKRLELGSTAYLIVGGNAKRHPLDKLY